MTHEDETGVRETLHGQVKWFDPTKGFGFVVADRGGPDILLHANVLRNFGQSSVADGARIELVAQSTQRGMQAVEVLAIEPPEGGELDHDVLTEDHVDLADAGPMEPARVKWFDKGKGFGFANIFGKPEDVFIHIEVLRRSGFADLQPGEAVCLRVIDGSRGRMAVLVCAWDTAAHERDHGDGDVE
jgi:cold shock protein